MVVLLPEHCHPIPGIARWDVAGREPFPSNPMLGLASNPLNRASRSCLVGRPEVANVRKILSFSLLPEEAAQIPSPGARPRIMALIAGRSSLVQTSTVRTAAAEASF
jgi:hypothetical protein